LSTHFFDTASYHAGKTATERANIQLKFMTNKLAIVVATIAFGMGTIHFYPNQFFRCLKICFMFHLYIVYVVFFISGLDKPDIRAVIHLNMPSSLENYIQETGRAGRDGLTSYCHLFVNDSDVIRARSLRFAEVHFFVFCNFETN
jgi:ATP-dependent DNA helicase Q4